LLVVGHTTKQMKHACSWNIQICCPSVEMSSLGLRPRDDMSTSGQHIWMFHFQPCIICIMLYNYHELCFDGFFLFTLEFHSTERNSEHFVNERKLPTCLILFSSATRLLNQSALVPSPTFLSSVMTPYIMVLVRKLQILSCYENVFSLP